MKSKPPNNYDWFSARIYVYLYVTCPDTLATSYQRQVATAAGKAPVVAEDIKAMQQVYSNPKPSCHRNIWNFATETLGTLALSHEG